MERVRICGGLMTKYLKEMKDKDCFKIYKDHDVNKFFWLLCIIGGILRSKKVGKKLKILWLIYHISLFCLLVGYNTYAFVHTKEKSLITLLMLLRPLSFLWFMIGSYSISIFFYKNIEKYSDDLDKYLSTSLKQEHDQYVAESKFLDMLVLFLIFSIFCIFGIQIFFPFAIQLEAHSKAFYLILLMAKFTFALPFVMLLYCGLGMRAIYVKKFLHTNTELINQIKSFSTATLQTLELALHQEMMVESDTSIPSEEQKYRLNLLTRRKNAIYENFDKNVAYFAKQHMKLYMIHKNIKTYYETVCSVVISFVFLTLVIFGIEIIQVMEGRSQFDTWTTSVLLLLLLNAYLLNEYCWVITVVDDRVQTLCNEIYSLPWYLLVKKNRRMIALLLNQCRLIPQCRIFGMYPFAAPLVPQVLNLGYSYVSVLRVLVLKTSQ